MSSTDAVEEQYSHYPYPEPCDDLHVWLKSWHYDPYDPSLFSGLFWAEGRQREDLQILVAGCGTMQAAVLAFKNPGCKITGIDFSETSITHEKRLLERHGLKNLTLVRMDLRDAPKLGQSFDLIVSSGVLHHLADPSEGLRALASVLEPSHGVMLVMLYGRLARIGIYALQDIFRRMNIPQTADGVKFVRDTIQRLSPRHPGRWYFDRSPEMSSDAAIVDTYLHKQDTAYCVQDVLDLVARNELVFKGWLDNGTYDHDWEGLGSNISDRDRWSIVENFDATISQHNFMVSRPERDPRSEVNLGDKRWFDYCPSRHPDLRPSAFDQSKGIRGKAEFTMSAFEYELMAAADGTQTIGQILKRRTFGKMPVNQRYNLANDFCKRMWRQGHMFFSLAPGNRHHQASLASPKHPTTD